MLIVAWVPLLVAIVGLILWIAPLHPKVCEAGKILFFCGVLVTLFGMAGETVRLGK